MVDDMFGRNKTKLNFYAGKQTSNYVGRYNDTEGTIIHYKFKASQFNTFYQRERFGFLDALTIMGGSFSSLKGVGQAFTAIFSYKLMQSSLIGKLFHFKPKFASEIKKAKKKNKKNMKVIPKKHKNKGHSATETDSEAKDKTT